MNIFSGKSEPELTIKDREKLGNTIGNIINQGYVCEKDNDIFFINKDSGFAIYHNGRLLDTHKSSGHVSIFINVKDDCVYYVNLVDNGLYTMTTEGENIERIYPHKLRNVIVYGNYIYAIDEDSGLCKIDCKTYKTIKTTHFENIKTDFIAPMDDFIYFNNINRENHLYKIHTGGERYPDLVYKKSCRHIITDSEQKSIYFICREDHKLYKFREEADLEVMVDRACRTMNLVSTAIYYVTEDGHLHEKIGNSHKEILGKHYDINLTEDEIYYHDGIDYHKEKISELIGRVEEPPRSDKRSEISITRSKKMDTTTDTQTKEMLKSMQKTLESLQKAYRKLQETLENIEKNTGDIKESVKPSIKNHIIRIILEIIIYRIYYVAALALLVILYWLSNQQFIIYWLRDMVNTTLFGG